MKMILKLRTRNFLNSWAIKGCASWSWSVYRILICVTQVTLTLWGSQAEEFHGISNPVLAVKNGRINEYGGGKSVSLLQSSVLQINPDTVQAHKLRGWFDSVGAMQEQENISGRTGVASGGESLESSYLFLISSPKVWSPNYLTFSLFFTLKWTHAGE
jgi:hypothetical protein